MTKRARKALEGSILRWWTNYHAAVAGEEINTDSSSCPLCREFDYGSKDCRGCPVFLRTGEVGCQDTPYGDVYWSQEDKRKLPTAVAKFIRFLESLRDYPHERW